MNRPLSLRTRVLAGLATVAAVVVLIATLITTITYSQLVSQIDEQLIAASNPIRDAEIAANGPGGGPGQPPGSTADAPPEPPPEEPRERLGVMVEAVARPNARVVVIFQPDVDGATFDASSLAWEDVADRVGSAFTFSPDTGDENYRLYVSEAGDAIYLRGLSMSNVDETIQRLILFELLGVVVVFAVLAAVGWWVIRLGIRPIQAITHAASNIGDNDLSARVPQPRARGTEASDLAMTLNGAFDRIESAVDERRRGEERLRQFVADASHELRTPLTTIRGYAELYRHGGLSDTDQLDDALGRTEQEAERMSRLVEDMLALARLDREETTEPEPVDFSHIVTSVVADASVNAPHHEITHLVEADLVVAGREDRLRQVVLNVVTNATVHTPDGTAIDVAACRYGGEIVVTTTDDGPGIAPEHLAHVTERFYRADKARSRDRGGSGLGMAIVAGEVDAHDGSLEITSELGVGTTVTIRLPCFTSD